MAHGRQNRGGKGSRTSAVLLFLLLALLIIVPISSTVGPAEIGLGGIISVLTGSSDAGTRLVVADIRIPRMTLAFLVGAALAASGVVFQGLLTNPLAGPFTIGISSGAAFGASLAILAGLSAWCLPFAALLGAAIALGTVLLLSDGTGGLQPRTLVLAGIVVGSIFSAALSLIKSLSGESLTSIVFWIMGSLSSRGWLEVKIFLPYLIVGLIGMIIYARDLDCLCLGDDHAHSLGVDVATTRRVLIFFASMTAASAVAVSGVIGFVGLVVPHALRMILGPAHRRLLLVATVSGGTLLLYADTLARSLSHYGEVPVGVITALLGGPFFCILLTRRHSRGGAAL